MSSAVFSTLSDVVSFLAQSFRLAAVVPAFIFVFLNEVIILPQLPPRGFIEVIQGLGMQDQILVAVVLALIIGYIMDIINIPLIKLFEGYPFVFTRLGKCLQCKQRKKKEGLERLLHQLELEIKDMQSSMKRYSLQDPRRKLQYQNIKPKKQEIEALMAWIRYELIGYFPQEGPILPTSLGNVIAAFEEYPWRQYGIDAVVMWPRLLPILAREKYTVYVEREKAGLDFTINLSALLGVLSMEMAYTGLLFVPNYEVWLLWSALMLALSCAIYWAGIPAAYSWGMTVRVAFDLYRYHLLKALHGRPPSSFEMEVSQWRKFSAFFRGEGEVQKELKETSSIGRVPDMTPVIDYPRIGSEFSH